jgi:integrase
VALASNIVRRPGSARYYVRVAVPKKLQAFLGKKEVWKSLGTSDPHVARAKALPVMSRWYAEFEALMARREPSAADLQGASWDHYSTGMELDRLERAALPTGAAIQGAKDKLATDVEAGRIPWSGDPLAQLSTALDVLVMKDAGAMSREQRAHKLATVRQHLATGETALIEWAADDVIRRDRLLIEKGSAKYRDLCQRLQRAEIQMLERAEERDKGNWTGAPTDSVVAPVDATMGRKHAAPGETLAELYARYKTERQGRVSADTWAQNAGIVKLFFEFIGETSHVSAVTRKAVRDWKHALASWPRKATSIKEFEGMAFRKVIEANKTVGKPPISVPTTNRYISAIAPFCQWLFDAEYIEQDACQRMHLTVDKKQRTVYPWSGDELKAIFASPLFATCQGDRQEHLPGNVAIRDWRYWLPYLAAYSGARLGELSQMLTSDVRQHHGVWILHVTPEGSQDKSVKTDGSARVVPLHSRMIELGFLKYHAHMVERGEKQLFPELEPDTRGHFSRTPSRFFAGYFKDIGVKVDKSRNFHSFRHNATDAFRRGGYLDEQFGMLIGHTKATTTGRYGIMPEGILSERVKMIEAISYSPNK